MNPIQEFIHRARTSGSPGTVAIVVGMVLGFLGSFFSSGSAFYPWLSFATDEVASRPWSVLTFPFSYPPFTFLSIVFGALWLWGIGGTIERELGTGRFLGFFFGMSVIGALALWVGSIGINQSGNLATAWVPTAAVTVAWGTRNPNTPVQLMFVLPITGRWLAWFAALMVFFATTPQLAPFAAIPCVLAYLWAAEKLPFLPWYAGRSRRQEKKAEARFYDFKDAVDDRIREREERERLRKLFEGSLNDDPEDRRDAR